MPNLTRASRSIHYSRDGDGPGIVLVPGLGSGARLFGTLPRRFVRAGFTCCAIDPVGLDPSGPLPGGIYDFQQAALDVLAVAAELPQPVTLVGTSLGGKVALQAAATHSEHASRLVMLCSAAPQTPRSQRIYRWFERLCTDVPGDLLGDLTAPFLFGETFLNNKPDVVDNIVRSTKPSPESRAFMRAQVRALLAFDGAGLADQVQWPTLCLAGAEDHLTLPAEVEATATLISNAQFECIASAGHSLLLESAAAFDRVIEFVRA
ncbi:MAG: alpha/beta hydrolase [bacterium]|nr:alpha/beta hydrolase [bacterium]